MSSETQNMLQKHLYTVALLTFGVLITDADVIATSGPEKEAQVIHFTGQTAGGMNWTGGMDGCLLQR